MEGYQGDGSPLHRDVITAIENELELTMPSILTRIYTEVANGGFGPCYGMLGLKGGIRNEDGNDVIGQYKGYRMEDPEDPHWKWPRTLLPVFSLGCAMYWCVDCRSQEGKLVWFEPNPHEFGQSWSDAFFPSDYTLENLLLDWVDGVSFVDMLNHFMPGWSEENFGGQS